MPNLSATILAALTVNGTISLGTFGSPSFTATFGGSTQLGVGAAANQFNVAYCADRTVSSGSADTIDLTAGSIKQPDGSSATFADVIVLAIKNNSTTTGQNLQIGSGSNDVASILGTTGVLTLLPGATLIIVAPLAAAYALNSSTAHILDINVAAGTGVSYSIAILGH